MTLKKFWGRLMFLVVSEAILNRVALLIQFVKWRLDHSEFQLFLLHVKLHWILLHMVSSGITELVMLSLHL